MCERSVLVTGGAGYIGSHACKALHAAGYTPVTYDNLIYGHEKAVKWGPFIKGDILDIDLLFEVCKYYRPLAVMHFAAFAYVGESVESPSKYYKNNTTGTLNVLEVMRHFNVETIVFSSSCATYGFPETMPVNEDMFQQPVNPYGWTKLFGERMIKDYSASYGMRFALLRYFNACGADPDGEIGEEHSPETHLIPLTLRAALHSEQPLLLFGEDYDTPDGTCIRDYIHVSDLARAHVLALKHLLEKRSNLELNLGTGKGTSVREIILAVERVSERRVPVQAVSRRKGDPPSLYADVKKASNVLGFTAQYTDVSDMVQTAYNYMVGRDVL